MAESKGSNKVGETLLGVLGSLGTIAGPLIFGPDFQADLGMPFKLGSQYMQNSRMEKSLMEVLNSNPHTAEVVPAIQSAIQSGGLPGLLNTNLGQAPTQLSVPTPQSPYLETNLPTVVNAPEYNRMLEPTTSSVPVSPTPQPVVGKTDYTSDDFLRLLSQKRPDLAEKILVEKATAKPQDALAQIMAALKIQSFETPQEASERRLGEYATKSDIIEGRQQEGRQEAAELSKQAAREKWSVGELKFLQDSDAAINNSRFMLDKLNAGIEPTVLTALVGKSPVASRIATTFNPQLKDQIQEYRDILKTVMTAVKSQSGVQYGFRELQWIKSSQPNEWDTPEMFRNGITMAMNTQLWNKYGVIIKKAQRAGNAEVALREGMTPEQIKAWKILDAQLAKRATSAKTELNVFSDPANAKLLEALGMGMTQASKANK